MGTVLWHHGAGGCSHCRALLGTQGLLEVVPSGVAFLPTHEVVGGVGAGSTAGTILFLWQLLILEGVRSEPMAPEGLDPFSPLALCRLLLKSVALAMVSLILWDCHPPSKLAPRCPIYLRQPHFRKYLRRTTPLPTTKCPT